MLVIAYFCRNILYTTMGANVLKLIACFIYLLLCRKVRPTMTISIFLKIFMMGLLEYVLISLFEIQSLLQITLKKRGYNQIISI